MLSFPLEELHEAAKDGLHKQYNRIAQGDDAEVVLAEELEVLAVHNRMLCKHHNLCRPRYAIDWEDLGCHAEYALHKAMTEFIATGDRAKAEAVFHKILRAALREKRGI